MKIELIFRYRKFSYFKNKNWYSLYRWKNPHYYEDEDKVRVKLIDIGAITIGYRKEV